MQSFFETTKDLYATYAGDGGVLTVYHRQHGALLTARMLDTEDEWASIKVGDDIIDLNLWTDGDSGELGLTAYPTRVCANGDRETITGVYQQLKLEIVYEQSNQI